MMNVLDLYYLFKNEYLAFQFAINNNMIYYNEAPECPECKHAKMKIYNDQYNKFMKYFECKLCSKRTSILIYSVFNHSNLQMNIILYLIYCWVHLYSCKQTKHETKVNSKTVTRYFKLFRSACMSYVESRTNELIGGPNKVVEIDETLMRKRKNNEGRKLNEIWLFGGICRNDHKVFACVVDDRKAETLYDVILKNIAYGTTIVSDSWKGYHLIDSQPLPNVYNHIYVDHSKNFVDPITKAYTQNIERLWRELKRINKRYEGIRRIDVNAHLAEFIWRHNEITKNKDPFYIAVELIANTVFFQNNTGNQNKNEEEEEEDYLDFIEN